ncbi:MAG: VacJ family lipoprotein [Deltaproteobacteria bacterium]|nr:VacJ family lipoprotein [Deltaproteobacteria bacterium]
MKTTMLRICPVLLTLTLAPLFGGCASTMANRGPEVPAMHNISEVNDDFVAQSDDPWVGFNKSVYKFNYKFDQYIFLPVTNAYEFVTPTFVQTGVSNFFNNINEIKVFYNSLFQAKGMKALTTLGRFATNTTIGVLGFFDVATHFGMERQDEDFGQTLGVWGVGKGPYFVMPLVGPGTARSAGGFFVDVGIHSAIKTALDLPQYVDHGDAIQTGVTVVKTLDNRHQQPFRYYGTGYPFEYELIRYLQTMKLELATQK